MIKHVQKIEQVFDRIIIQRLESRKAHDYVITNDMLDTFLNISGVNSEDMDMTKLQHLLLILFTTGANTTSATLEWAMVELLRNPEKLSKAQQELGKIIGKGRPLEDGVLPETLNMEEKFGLTLQMAHPLRAREYAERRTTKNDAYWSQQCFSGCLECA
ncbi:PREDICTED: geraniol [Prunus dulcis]|uniref:PREDICTED: geraniol n=1 Tax=Prunus dulcis TaxID=3755 RepID=A0A5E4FB58_PRUDU|nr:PREDICTED: geraniol [Prunus dulcis]